MVLRIIAQHMANINATYTMEYGTNSHPPFKDDPPQLVADLHQEHVPSYTPPSPTEGPGDGGDTTHGRRLVIVGDVHGHLSTLQALLRKIGFDNKHGDHLILAGDITTKGPDSKGVVKLAMKLGASAVRGNQDDKVLAAAREIHRLSVDEQSRLGPLQSDEENDGVEDGGEDGEVDAETRKKDHARRVARSLSHAQLAWLRSLPIILRIGHLPDATAPPWNATTLVVVHGGLVPGVKLEKQDPWAVMNMRSLVYPGKGKGKGKKKNKGKHHKPHQADVNGDDNAAEDDGDYDGEEELLDEANTATATANPALAPDAVAVPIDGRDGEPWSHAW